MVKAKKRLKTSEFVGLSEFKTHMDVVLRNLTDEFNLETFNLDESERVGSALVYGPRGCGRVSYIVNLLIERGLIHVEQARLCTSQINAFVIDFERIDEALIKANFLTRLLDSIDRYSHSTKLGNLIVVKNLELLFERNQFESVGHRFIAALLFYMEQNSKCSRVVFNSIIKLLCWVNWTDFN